MKRKAAIFTISDRSYLGEREDISGQRVKNILEKNNFIIIHQDVLPDDREKIENALINTTDKLKVNLIVTTGGTGFSTRDVTPEATLFVIDKRADGLSEKMRYESNKITERAALSRAVAGIRKNTLIINLPGSPKAAEENLNSIIEIIPHGLDMIEGENHHHEKIKNKRPTIEDWIKELERDENADKCGIYLAHLGKVRRTSRKKVRENQEDVPDTKYMEFSYDEKKVKDAKQKALNNKGVYFVKIWLNTGKLKVGDDIMQIIVGADIRDNCIKTLEQLIKEIKTNCVVEKEIF